MTDDDAALSAFFRLYEGMPRGGPGSDASTEEALDRLPPLPDEPRVVDMGCGPGRQTLVLARRLGGSVLAVDIYGPFLSQLRQAAEVAGLAGQITIRQADFGTLVEPRGWFDLLWAEGAVYLLGFETGLAQWRSLLKPAGLAAITEITWLRRDPPAEARQFWGSEEGYPAMTSIAGNLERAVRAGFDHLDHFVLPANCWWEEYYRPLERRLDALEPYAAADPALAMVIGQTRREIDVFRRFGHTYGYVFYLLRRSD